MFFSEVGADYRIRKTVKENEIMLCSCLRQEQITSQTIQLHSAGTGYEVSFSVNGFGGYYMASVSMVKQSSCGAGRRQLPSTASSPTGGHQSLSVCWYLNVSSS
ncbi:hypothetical protein CRM22_001220 [Opisthorchis felineus]|uniref:Uncharacterized protein n=1 Tax=Opisthorchis felineus TaxID=147828 RepID=A0A4S2MBL2_OPIFE|nr:hypothetical protein CRM22_001220 [Opisthorchis felineus]